MTATPTEGVTQADIDFVEQLIELCIYGCEWSVNRHNAVQLAARHRAAEVERLRGIIQEAVDHADADEGEYGARCVDSVNMLRRFLAGES